MDANKETTAELGFWDQHRFLILIGLAITIALVLVSISMALYSSSGAIQLDLSRPGYKTTSQTTTDESGFIDYPTSGKLDNKAISDFKTLYDAQAAKAKAVDAFGGDPLNPDTLDISAPQTN
ncbi:hypothetical protein EPN95_03790 [Patescibacteria group bacterium]|nr:MAG: hypothetical protein EPN95_03790 [Patescibacteria group bacterium]